MQDLYHQPHEGLLKGLSERCIWILASTGPGEMGSEDLTSWPQLINAFNGCYHSSGLGVEGLGEMV